MQGMLAAVPDVQRQNPDKSKAEHDTNQLPSVLSKVQTRNIGKCTTTRNISYQSAGRPDAEPITTEKIVGIGSVHETKKR